MNKTEPKNPIKKFALINLLFSICFFFFAKQFPLVERLFGMIVINIGYFMFYYFISRGPISQLKWLRKNNSERVYSLQKKMIELFAIASRYFALLSLLILIVMSIFKKEYFMMFAVFTPLGIYFGAIKLKIEIDKLE